VVGLDFNMLYNIFMNLKHSVVRLAFLFLLFVLPTLSFAQGINPGPCETSGKICNPIPSVTSIPALIQTILIGVIKIGIPIIALALIYSGFLFVAAQGNSEKLETAKKSLLYTIIGAAILLGAWAIAILISETVLGIS
jgi:hypothetical protein